MSSATPPTAASGRFAFSFCGHQVALRFFISLLERFVTNRLHILSDEDFKNLIRLKIYVDLFKHLSIQSSTSLNLAFKNNDPPVELILIKWQIIF